MNMATNHAWLLNQATQSRTSDQWRGRNTSPLCGPMLTIYAGADRLLFTVHLKVMCAQSLFFHKRFPPHHTPLETELTLHFPGIDAGDMALFTTSAYRHYWHSAATTSPDDIVEHVRLYLVSLVFEAGFIQKQALADIIGVVAGESHEWVRMLGAGEFERHLQVRMEVVRMVYEAVDGVDGLKRVLVRCMAMHSEDYYVCAERFGLDIDKDLARFFGLVPGFAADLKWFLSQRKCREVVEEEEEFCGSVGGWSDECLLWE